MDLDDLEPRIVKARLKNLDEMSLDAIKAYIETLKVEIARAQSTIAAKEAALLSAHTFFKS